MALLNVMTMIAVKKVELVRITRLCATFHERWILHKFFFLIASTLVHVVVGSVVMSSGNIRRS